VLAKKIKPRRGRPPTTGPGLQVVVRMHDPLLAVLDGWIAAQDEAVSRPEAVRRLVEMSLESGAKKPRKQ
jgi:hypothetical protein